MKTIKKTTARWIALAIVLVICFANLAEGFAQTGKTLPFLETFNPPFPAASGMGSSYDGWTAPPTNTTYLEEYVTNFWVSYDGSYGMNMRNRRVVNGVRQTTYLISPAIEITGNDPVIAWAEAASTNAWSGPRDSPINLYIATTDPDNPSTNWTQVSLAPYTTGGLPNAWLGEAWQHRSYSLQSYIGQTIWWKWELTSTLQNGLWEYTYWCLDNVYVGDINPILAVDGGPHSDFGNIIKGFPLTKKFRIFNAGGGSLTINSITILPSPGSGYFSNQSTQILPVTIYGGLGGAGISELVIPIKFDPLLSGSFSPVLQINYTANGVNQTYPYVLHGNGVTCNDATEILDSDFAATNVYNIVTGQGSIFYYTPEDNEEVQVTSCHLNQLMSPANEYSWDTYLVVKDACDGAVIKENDDTEVACQYNRTSSAVQVSMVAGHTYYIYWPLLFPESLHAYEPFVFTITRPMPPWPNAEFSTPIREITQGQTITYTDNSSGNPTSGIWRFYIGCNFVDINSLTPPPQVTYPNYGLFSVFHTATNQFGTGNLLKNGYILVNPSSPSVPFPSYTLSSIQFYVGEGDPLKMAKSDSDEAWIFKDITQSGMNWQIRNTGINGCSVQEGPMPSTTGSTGYLVLPADEYNCIDGIQTDIPVEAYAQSPSFDCSDYEAIFYEFEQRFNYTGQESIMEFQVSNDGGVNWVAFDIIQNRAENQDWGDPVIHESINITDIAQHQPDVRIRFYWKGSTGYYWMIDDIEIKGYKVCSDIQVEITGKDQVFYGYAPLSYSVLTAEATGDAGPFTYLWSTGETTETITISPTQTTEYVVELTGVQGCKIAAVFTVNVEDVRCGEKLDKVLMCKKEKKGKATEIRVSPNAVPAQLRTGATLGSCKSEPGMGGGSSGIELFEPDLLLYPNPSNGFLNIELNGWTDNQMSIEVRDVLGRTIYREEVKNSEMRYINSIEINQSGIYYINVKGSSVNLSKQVTVIR